ncbi:MAG: hypothetical protein IJD94_07005 [Clostridia bacterium]|nr:hypothetical protein [Clostridia bacterium]
MGMMETKIIQVKNDPQVINEVNEAWGRWGWSVLNIQVTHSQNTREYQDWTQYGSNQVTVETTTINYATITYQRDKGMPNYARLVQLEHEYDQVEARIWSQFAEKSKALSEEEKELPAVHKPGGRTITAMLLCAYLSVMSLYLKTSGKAKDFDTFFVIIAAGAAIGFIFNLKRYLSSKSPENRALLEKNTRKQAENKEARAKLEYDYNHMVREEKSRILSEAAQLLQAA